MCLISKTNEPSIASKNIVVWKLLEEHEDFIGKYYTTPFHRVRIDLNEPLCANEMIHITHFCSNKFKIDKGYIHCYQTAADARFWVFCHNSSIKICKAIIPKGTEYFMGEDGDICAKKIIFIKANYFDRLLNFLSDYYISNNFVQ